VPDYVSIAYRGATYALGQGPQFYGIWYASALQVQPLESWPLTPEGWTAAWSKFVSVEVPGSITPVAPVVAGPVAGPVGPMTGPVGPVASPSGPVSGPAGPAGGYADQVPAPDEWAAGATDPAGSSPGPVWYASAGPDPAAQTRNPYIAAALIVVGLVLGVAGLFPAYFVPASLASQTVNLVPHVMYLAAWALSGVLIVLGGTRLRAGALLGLGTSAVTLGLFVADLGTPASQGAHGAGLTLSILGWLGCTAGLAVAATRGLRGGLGLARGLARRFGSQPSHDIVPLVTMILAAIGAAVAFAPAWDRYTVRTGAGSSQTITLGNAFANAGAMITGDVLAMIAIVAVVVVAALWRPLRLAAALAIGAAVPMVAQAISAVIQIQQQPLTAEQLTGLTPAQVAALRVTVDSGLTPIFWVYCAFVGTVILLCVWMLVAHGPAVADRVLPAVAPVPGWSAGSGPAAGGPAPAGGGPVADWGPGSAVAGNEPLSAGPPEADAATTTAPWTGGAPGGQATTWDRPAN
jgi:hypothetical protein